MTLKSGHVLHSGPPPGSGLILGYILRILDGLWPAPNVGLAAHRMIEAFKFGYGQRSRLGDHKFVNISEVRLGRPRPDPYGASVLFYKQSLRFPGVRESHVGRLRGKRAAQDIRQFHIARSQVLRG